MGLTVTPEPGGLLRVPYETATAQELIARIRTPLSILRVHEPSLEEAYVELLREPEEAVA
jgi:ABC-2 type transport system ATP-binding protein